MDITARDILTGLGIVFMGTGVYVAIVQRITRMEALLHRIEQVESDVEALQLDSKALAVLTSQVVAHGVKLASLEGTMEAGIASILSRLPAPLARPNA